MTSEDVGGLCFHVCVLSGLHAHSPSLTDAVAAGWKAQAALRCVDALLSLRF